ncbi:hypothetical protein [Pelagicoccus mobilis]|uniref:TonB C-terminal domain-containing protein n=1 Tax=Pelagicoccus mobilis TaxID=415221 RepID=A0A934VSM6_9BACT|nr:hypothetical protein [Pelagicoccus mobilis]MBK1878828.1 hypothetical protein [Pelagicoccus mobilis]
MKYINKLSALVAIFVLGGVSSASAQPDDSVTRTYTLPNFTVEGVSNPVLQSYSTPRVHNSTIGTEITMYYTINKKGRVQSIRSNAGPFSEMSESELSILMTRTLRSWKFTPATNGVGEPVSIRVSMPVKVMSPGAGGDAYAGIVVKDMKLVAKSG